MGAVTLTDRVSVSVRASTGGAAGAGSDKTSQDRATARNVADTLGGKDDLTDAQLDEIANAINNSGGSSSPNGRSVIDENGNEYVPIEAIIAAGKKMAENGAFDGTEIHEGLDDGNGGTVNIAGGVTSGPISFYTVNEDSGWQVSLNIPNVYYLSYLNSNNDGSNTWITVYMFSKTNFTYSQDNHYTNGTSDTTTYTGGAATATINNVNYSFFYAAISAGLRGSVDPPVTGGSQPTNAQMAAYLFGETHTDNSGSLIDWDAPNAEIERQIKEHYETFDPADHDEGAPGMWAGGYVLAGQLTVINPANPSTPPDPEEET